VPERHRTAKNVSSSATSTREREWIEDQSPLFTSTITFTEAVRYFITEERDPETIFACLNDIRIRCTVVPVDEAIAILAGHLKNREV
jgi:hypothetical protein